MGRRLVRDYEHTLGEILMGLSNENHAHAIQIAEIPKLVRGYDLVKKRHVQNVEKYYQELLDRFRTLNDNKKHKSAWKK